MINKRIKNPAYRVGRPTSPRADIDEVKKGEPRLMPVHGILRGKEPVKEKYSGKICKGIIVDGRHKQHILKLISNTGIAVYFSRIDMFLDGVSIVKVFLCGKPNDVEAFLNDLNKRGWIIKTFSIPGSFGAKPPDLWRGHRR